MGDQERLIDRWPAWLIAVYASLTIGLHTGILNCGALFYPALMETFNQPISVVSWLVTGQYAVAFCFSPLYNRLIDYIPNRIAITAAVLLTTGSMIGSSMVYNIWAFLSLYTFLAGIGLGVSVVRAISTAAEYFDRYRILALAVCSGGSGLGTFVYSKIGAYMMEKYTWRVALIGYALLHLHVIVMGILLKPLPPEPVPEPTVLITEHPDLSSSDLPTDLIHRKNEPGQSVFLSIMSVNSLSAGLNTGRGVPPNRSRTDLSRRNTIASDIRVVIEFVKAARSGTEAQPVVCIDPISFLPDPGSRVLKQLEDAAQDALLEGDATTPNQVMIPMLFIVSDFNVIQVETHDPIVGSQLKVFLDSRFDLSASTGRPEETATQAALLRPVPFGDTFASSMVILQDRRRVRQTIRAVITRGQQKVETIAAELQKRGQFVYPNPVVALVDQNTEEPGPARVSQGTSAQYGYLRSNLALDNYVIPEENEPEHGEEETADFCEIHQEPHTEPFTTNRTAPLDRDRTRAVHRLSQLRGSQSIVDNRPFVWTGRVKRKSSATLPFESVVIQSSTELPQSKISGAQSHDIFASVISMNTPHEVAEVLESKYFDEIKTSTITTTGELMDVEKTDRFLLMDMMFFTFLLTRLLVFIADSIMFAHLSNFAIVSGFDPDSAAGLISFIGIANMLGRFGTGAVGQFAPRMELRCLTAVCLLALAVHCTIMPLSLNYVALAIFATSYGLLVSPSFAFAPTIAYDIVGPGRYDQAIAFVFQFEAIGYLVGGPIGGAIKELNNNYFECFLFAGSNEMVAAAILLAQVFVIQHLFGKFFRRCTEKSSV